MFYIPKNVPTQPEYRYGEIPVDQYLKIHAKRIPRKVCMIFYGTEITYEEFDLYVDKLATVLANLGVKKGDPVAIYMQNCPQFAISYYAIQRIGAIAAPFSPMFKEWDLEFELNELNARVIIANNQMYPVINNVRHATKLEHVILAALSEFLPEEPAIPFLFHEEEPAEFQDVILFQQALHATEPDVPQVKIHMDDVCLILFTSGTTGLPKGAMLTYENELYTDVGASQCFYHHGHNIWLHTQPMCHIVGLSFMGVNMYNGSTTVLITKMNEEVICRAIEKYHVDSWYTTAVMIKKVVDWPETKAYHLCSVRLATVSSFGVVLTEELADAWAAITGGGVLVETGYGMTESHTFDTAMPPEYVEYGSNGVPLFPEMKLSIIDEEGHECPPGEMGEIVLKNKGVFKGYLDNPEATEAVLKNGALYTGDLGSITEGGQLRFMGRKKDMIKSSGFSVFPEEVEMYLMRHEAVDKAVVIGKPDDRKGQIIKAFVVLKDGCNGKITEDELVEWSKDKMAAYKRPREIEFRDGLPLTTSGKLQRAKLRKEEEETETGNGLSQ